MYLLHDAAHIHNTPKITAALLGPGHGLLSPGGQEDVGGGAGAGKGGTYWHEDSLNDRFQFSIFFFYPEEILYENPVIPTFVLFCCYEL